MLVSRSNRCLYLVRRLIDLVALGAKYHGIDRSTFPCTFSDVDTLLSSFSSAASHTRSRPVPAIPILVWISDVLAHRHFQRFVFRFGRRTPSTDLSSTIGFEIFLSAAAPFNVSLFFASYCTIPIFFAFYAFWKVRLTALT